MFFDFQRPGGSIIDGFTERSSSTDPYNCILSSKHPALVGHKNSVSADQESSLVLAVRRYVERTGDDSILSEVMDGRRVIERLADALEFVFRERWSERHGLAWNATAIDGGDTQPEEKWGVEMSAENHPAIGVYVNAMLP